MSMSLTIRPMALSDIDEVSALARRIWMKHYAGIISAAQIEYMLEQMYSKENLEKQVTVEGHLFHLALLDGKIAGYVSVEKMPQGEYFMHKFYIDGTQQRKGLGGQVMAYLEAEYSDMRAMRLKVNRVNVQAINFYFKNGFTIE